MRILLVVMVFVAGCGGGEAGEQDAGAQEFGPDGGVLIGSPCPEAADYSIGVHRCLYGRFAICVKGGVWQQTEIGCF